MSQYVDDTDFDSNLRLGDIIDGFSHIMATFDDFFSSKNEFKLDIKDQSFYAVLTPCCSIEDKLITVVPLKQIKASLISNPFYKEDFTRINRPMPPDKSVPPEIWEKFPEEKKSKEIEKGEGYSLFELFFYSPANKLPEYAIKYKAGEPVDTRTYMIDFKEAFTITSKKIKRGNTYPKVLQLTIPSRGELRNKLAYFYSRIPDEDKV